MSEQTVNGSTADSLARLYTAEAMGLLVQVVRGDVPAKTAERVRAAEDILDRGHGRAVQAVISVPSRVAVAMKLAQMSDEALMRIAQRGSGERKEGPVPPGNGGGTHPEGAEPSMPLGGMTEAMPDEYELPSDERGPVDLPPPRMKRSANRNLPVSLRNADVVDAEIEVDPLG